MKQAIKPTAKPITKENIVFTSMIVKKIAPTTYRYFFNVADNDTSDFKGDISIQILNGHTDPMPLIWGGATQSFSDNPISAGTNAVVHFDDSHAPHNVDGIDGASTFSYSVTINGDEVASGKGNIDQYEDDSQQ